jgi:hypothetical protein
VIFRETLESPTAIDSFPLFLNYVSGKFLVRIWE